MKRTRYSEPRIFAILRPARWVLRCPQLWSRFAWLFWIQEEVRMSSRNRFTGEVKSDSVAQVVDRGYGVGDVAKRLGVRTKSL